MARETVVCLKRDGGCGRRFSRVIGSGKEQCDACDPPVVGAVLRLQNDPTPTEVPGDPGSAPQDGPQRFLGPVESATLETLTKRKRLDTPEAALAVTLARRIDGPGNSGNEMASLSKALREALRDALVGAPAEADGIDDLTRRRALRAGGA